MILSLPPQCIDIVMESVSTPDLLSMACTCKFMNDFITAKIYDKIYYLPGYTAPNGELAKSYRLINNEARLQKFLERNARSNKLFEFVNLSDSDRVAFNGVGYNLNQLGTKRSKGELFVPFQVKNYPKNYSSDYLGKFEQMIDELEEGEDLTTLSIVIKNDHSMQDNERILNKIDASRLQKLELIIIDDGNDLMIFKTLVLLVAHFELQTLSVMYFNQFDDNKNNLRIMLINSMVMQAVASNNLQDLQIYLDLVGLNLTQLTLLQQQLLRFQGETLSFNCNLSNLEVDFVILKELNFFKNFISNSSIVILLFEEFLKIDQEHKSKLLAKLNSNLKSTSFQYQIDFKNEFSFTNYFLKRKLRDFLIGRRSGNILSLKRLSLFNINFKVSKNGAKVDIDNLFNYNDRLVDHFNSDMDEINSIFSS